MELRQSEEMQTKKKSRQNGKAKKTLLIGWKNMGPFAVCVWKVTKA